MTKPLNLRFRKVRNYLWITLPDLITVDNYQQIENRIDLRLEDKSDKIVIDLSNIYGIHSLLIGLILHVRKIVKKCRGSFYLVNVSKACIEEIKNLFLDRLLQTYESEEQFIADCDNQS